MCDDCEEAGCHIEIYICTYRRSVTEPSECDHLYYRLPFEGDIARCAWCAHEVDDPAEVGL